MHTRKLLRHGPALQALQLKEGNRPPNNLLVEIPACRREGWLPNWAREVMFELGFLDGGLHMEEWEWRGAFQAEDPASAKST